MGRVLVIVLLLGWVGVAWAIRRRRLLAARREAATPRLPPRLRGRAGRRTWVLVTAPGALDPDPVMVRLRELDPESRIVAVDATRDPELVRSLQLGAVPALVLADGAGRIRHRLADPDVGTGPPAGAVPG